MIVEAFKEEEKFKPVHLHITLESEGELLALYNIVNTSGAILRRQAIDNKCNYRIPDAPEFSRVSDDIFWTINPFLPKS